MGILETIDSMDLADDVKERLRREHQEEIAQETAETAQLRAQVRLSSVNEEIEGLKKLGLDQSPGLLKFVRRVFLSDDQEVGLVLLSDNELDLSGDTATGATAREEISVAGAVRKFIELLPRNAEGGLVLSDQALLDDADDTRVNDDDDDDEKSKSDKHRESLGRVIGRPIERTRKRYGSGA